MEGQEDGVVKLNVGGEVFLTTWTTLLPKADGLSNFFSGLRALGKRDETGAFFIDREGGLFRFVLHYLRTGVWLRPSAPWTREALVVEGQYYGVDVSGLAPTASSNDVVMLHVFGGATMANFVKAVQVHIFGPVNAETQKSIAAYLDEYEQRDKNVFELPHMKTQPTVSCLVMSSCLDLGLVYQLVRLICGGGWRVTSHSNAIIPECPHQRSASTFTRLDFQFTFERV